MIVKYMRLRAICWNLVGSHTCLESGRSLTVLSRGVETDLQGHPELEELTQHVVSLADQYAFGGTDHFDPEEVMKVPQILHVERCRKLELHAVDLSPRLAPVMTKSSTYSKILTGPS